MSVLERGALLIRLEAGPRGAVRVSCGVCRWGRWCANPAHADAVIVPHVAGCTGLPAEIWEWPRAEFGSGF